MNIEKIQKEIADTSRIMDNSTINELLEKVIPSKHKGIDFCVDSIESYQALNEIETLFVTAKNREIYNVLLDRKPISYHFSPTNRKRAIALLFLPL